jgi:DNA polymerase III delta prime subunit
MSDYDFHQLSPYDLETLARDLLQARWGVQIESFKTGKDGGIDLRCALGRDQIVVQVKHYFRTGVSGLLREIRAEVSKIRSLSVTRYILVTTVPLSPVNKAAIIQIIGADLLSTADVIGRDDLNNMISLHPEIEGKHYKLWLASRAILDRVINNAAVTRSEFKAQQVYEQAKRYVVSDAFPKALEMLSSERIVIVAGPPGVGKTTLADLLLYDHLEKGYQAVLIQREVEEGEALFQPGVRQIFYFDDFMGATFAGENSSGQRNSSDRALVNFVAMIRATPDARLVLTTREHVYAQAIGRSERLRHSGLDDLRVFLSMPDYSAMQRARILYNHLYFSDLPDPYREELLRDNFYMRIVKHKKLNPRLIEWLSSYRRLKHVPVELYCSFIDGLLQDPSEIWRHAYEQEITETGRSVLLAIHSLEGKCGGVALNSAFNSLHKHRARRYNFSAKPDDFRSGIREVVNSFIKPWGPQGFEVIDPSVVDLLNLVVREAPDNAADAIAGAHSFVQVDHLWKLAKSDHGCAILATLKQDAEILAPSITRLAGAQRRFQLEGKSAAYFGPSYEQRLKTIIEMALRLKTPVIEALIAPAYNRMVEEWQTERLDINDAVELVRAIDSAGGQKTAEMAVIRLAVLAEALEEARTGCRADELREILSVMDTEVVNGDLEIARESFAEYQRRNFSEDLRECRSREQFETLMEDMEFFRDQLGVKVDAMVQRVEQEKDEFEEQEDQYSGSMQDEWKERGRDERANDRDIADMFGSLSGHRT